MRRSLRLAASARLVLAILIFTAAIAQAAAPPPLLAADSSPTARWRAALQSAPGRDVLPMLALETIPEVHPLANGDILATGTVNVTNTPTGERLAVAELRADGRLDPSFGEGGVELTQVKLIPWQTLVLADGKLLILGPSRLPGSEEPRITRFPDWELLRLLPDGQPDPSFGHDGLLDLTGVPVAGEGASSESAPQLEPDGGVLLPTVIGPLFSPSTVIGLMRLNPDGSRDTSFADNGLLTLTGGLAALAVRPDGTIVVAGAQGAHTWLQRFTPLGAPDTSFDGGAQVQLPLVAVDSMLVEADGAIVLHGYPQGNELIDNRVLRYTASGAADPTWGSAGVLDLGANFGYINRLLPASAGSTLLVTIGVPTSLGPSLATALGPSRVRVLRLTASGQIDPTLGGAGGLSLRLPFGGGSYASGAIADLNDDSFFGIGVAQRADGTLLFNGRVEAAEVLLTEGGAEPIAWAPGFAIAALNASFELDATFNGAKPPRLTVRVLSTRTSAKGVMVRLTSSDAALAVVRITAAGQTVARGTVPFFGKGQTLTRRTLRIALTRAGRKFLHRPHLRIAVSVTAVDLAGNRTVARTATTING
ncbi:MAG TPA: hypothetical protein VED41_02360 [Solirubrobacteraceae bacterium]|nr:hypothetical protein [Solirubrobacteraceae bacterium]